MRRSSPRTPTTTSTWTRRSAPAYSARSSARTSRPRPSPRPLTLSAFGMHLHAATTVDGRDRQQLYRLCRYLLRPPFAHDAVQALEGGRVRVHFKAPWRRGEVISGSLRSASDRKNAA